MRTVAEFNRAAVEKAGLRRAIAVKKAALSQVGNSGDGDPGQVAKGTKAAGKNAVPQFGPITAPSRKRNAKRKTHESHQWRTLIMRLPRKGAQLSSRTMGAEELGRAGAGDAGKAARELEVSAIPATAASSYIYRWSHFAPAMARVSVRA